MSDLDFLNEPSSNRPPSPRHYPARRKKSPVGLYIFGGLIVLAMVGGIIAYYVVQADTRVQKKVDEATQKFKSEGEKADKDLAETEQFIKRAKQQLAGVEEARKTIKQDRENYNKIISSDHGYGSTMKEVTALLGDTKDWHKSEVGSTSFITATWRNELRTITITAKYFSAEERGYNKKDGDFCVISMAWYNN